ncbi:2'-5' RNA ligase family protein [Fulvivirgaceae bacterium BMA12]|uniref:2'-5' RNA ligase family protein n=1 Tax=Agaribacillus aureus TaxID=3051825 RepID=A0ABT8LH37_9BACT|nr:2'-5' RNA ligase family protein [Fulvivirgaceae bacterium BMA12]
MLQFSLDMEVDPPYAFLILISPPDHIKQAISTLKKNFQNKYNVRTPWSIPHITVAQVLRPKGSFRRFFMDMKNTIRQIRSFDLLLWDYDHFEGSNTLFIDVLNQQDFGKFRMAIEPIRKWHGIKSHYQAPAHGHLTIEKQLPPPVFKKAINEFKRYTYRKQFVVRELTVLCKGMADKKYSIYGKIPLAD